MTYSFQIGQSQINQIVNLPTQVAFDGSKSLHCIRNLRFSNTISNRVGFVSQRLSLVQPVGSGEHDKTRNAWRASFITPGRQRGRWNDREAMEPCKTSVLSENFYQACSSAHRQKWCTRVHRTGTYTTDGFLSWSQSIVKRNLFTRFLRQALCSSLPFTNIDVMHLCKQIQTCVKSRNE